MFASITFIVLVLVIVALCGHCTAEFAARRGRSRGAWFILGAIFFPIPSIVLVLLPPHRAAQP